MERTAAERSASVFLGVDTHSDAHVGVALDETGRRLGVRSVPNTEAGYVELLGWALGFGALIAAGVEGTGSYGAGLSRFLRARRANVLEVNRTSRQHRRRHGKHDAGDAEAERLWPAPPRASLRAPTGPRNRCEPCASPGAPR